MKRLMITLTAAVIAAFTASAQAAVSAEEAKLLGTTLTTFGAEVAGNKEGTIPPYTGGITAPPPGYVEGKYRPDPYAGEKPLFSIDAKNMDKYADKLSEGTKALMKKFPNTYRLDVYKTHRSVAYPKYVQENQLKNAARCKTTNEGLSLSPECYGGTPFPIPKDGYEVMWNHQVRFGGTSVVTEYETVYVDATGKAVVVAVEKTQYEWPYYDPKKTSAEYSMMVRNEIRGPARVAGERGIWLDPLDWAKTERKIWQYLPGQRRVRLTPDLAYDTPVPSRGGSQTMDDVQMFRGKMDRFDFKLVGKKELYIPSNNWRFLHHTTNEEVYAPNHINPDTLRWELHRVWVVEATLKPGKRHVYQKRVFYIDEDSWSIVLSDQYDAADKMYRAGMAFCAPMYEVPAPLCGEIFGHTDLMNGVYVVLGRPGKRGSLWTAPPLPAREWAPDSLSGSGIR